MQAQHLNSLDIEVVGEKATTPDQSGAPTQSSVLTVDFPSQPPKPDASSTSSVLMGIANLVNFTIGAGVIGLPNTFCKIGTVLGFTILILTGLLVTWGARVVVKVKESTGLTSMVDMAESLLGRAGFWFLSLSEWFFLFCAMITYTVMVAEFTFPLLRYVYVDNCTALTEKDSIYYRTFVAIMIVLIIPTLLLKDLSVLGKISTVASFSILLLACMTSTAVWWSNADKSIVDNNWPSFKEYSFFDILGSMGCVLFAFFNVNTITDIHQSLKTPSKIQRVAVIGNFISILFYIWVASPVYLFTGTRKCDCTKLEGTSDRPVDMLYVHMFSVKEDGSASLLMIAIASLGVAVNVLCSIPLYHFILRLRSYGLYCRINNKENTKDSKDMPNWFFMTHSLLYLVVAAVAIGMPYVLLFLDFVGSVAGSSFLLIIPALLAMSIENGGIIYNISYTLISAKDSHKRTSVLYMLLLNFILYFGVAIFANSFVFLVNTIIAKPSA